MTVLYPPLAADACERLRAARKAQGLRQVDVAQRAGISVTTYYRIERGKRGVAPDVLSRIAHALSLDAPPEADEAAPTTPVGAMIPAARRKRGWSRRRAVQRLWRSGATRPVRRLACIEQSGAD